MAKLCRLCKLCDRFDTQVFTFQLAASILRENTPDLYSREFYYGNQIWTISVSRNEKHIIPCLTLCKVSAGLVSKLDYTFSLINSEHFSKNEVQVERCCTFFVDKSSRGCETFIGVGDLNSRGFIHSNGELLLELEMRNILIYFEQVRFHGV